VCVCLCVCVCVCVCMCVCVETICQVGRVHVLKVMSNVCVFRNYFSGVTCTRAQGYEQCVFGN